eukprot:CAMPEP_0170190902 /NCGR_PEP_ID=MMETSP0040_2-20121228/50392_1 /TAXON_ID=641309 /ORGANISM="Lotharella oceanica, Strain CCMP622" /LENGTH=74 /DNA_ID=CAMNT_0010438867 /DNA_START=255 /DNA_END=478 /DNA_ORIENTATION=-
MMHDALAVRAPRHGVAAFAVSKAVAATTIALVQAAAAAVVIARPPVTADAEREEERLMSGLLPLVLTKPRALRP